MPAARYFDLVREMRDAYNHRLRLVHCARREGLEPAARTFATTVPTVRKWLRRYQQHGPSGLREHSRAHHRAARFAIAASTLLASSVFLDYYLNDSGRYDVPSFPYLDATRATGPRPPARVCPFAWLSAEFQKYILTRHIA